MLRVGSRVIGGWLLATGVLGTALVGACADNKGALMLAINTDMRAPKDVNAVSVTISTNGAIKHSFIGRVTPQGEVLLPATLAVVEPDDKSATIRIRVMAFQNQKPRVLRDVRTTIPSGGRTALLRIPLNFVNDGMVNGAPLPAGIVPDPIPGTGGGASGTSGGASGTSGGASGTSGGASGTSGGASGSSGGASGSSGGAAGGGGIGGSTAGDFDFFGSFQPPCPNIQDETPIDGECKDNYVDPETLPDFDQNELGDSTDVGSCFDLAKCFAGAIGVGEGSSTGSDIPDASAGGRDAVAPPMTDAGGPGECPAPLTFCEGCVDIQTDSRHCGGCFKSCAGGKCQAGVCMAPFAGSSLPKTVTLDKNACIIQLNGANPARLNLAVVTPDTGECVRPGECYVPIDRGAGGWEEKNGSIQLPKFVCALLNTKHLRLATSVEMCAAKEEKNPICTPKAGDVPAEPTDAGNDSSIGGTVLIVPEDFPTTVTASIEGNQLYFAGASRAAQLSIGDLASPQATNINGVTASHLPWRFGQAPFGATSLTNGSQTGFLVQGTMAKPATVAAGAVDSSTVGGTTFWAVTAATQGGVYQGATDGGAAVRVLQSLVTGASAITAITPAAFVYGDTSGNVRLCDVGKNMCGQASRVAQGRVDAVILKPNDPLNGYALLQDGVYSSRIVDQVTGAISTVNLVKSPTGAVMENNQYYPRGLAANDKCVFFSSAKGVEFAIADAPGSGGMVADGQGHPVLGVAAGRDPQGGFAVVYFAVYSGLNQGGGIYRADLPSVCGGRLGSSSTGDGGGGGLDSGADSSPQAECSPANCQTGCCDYSVGGGGVCLDFLKQTNTKCNFGGNACQDCTPTGFACMQTAGGGMCGGG